jgi:hypothetical protein
MKEDSSPCKILSVLMALDNAFAHGDPEVVAIVISSNSDSIVSKSPVAIIKESLDPSKLSLINFPSSPRRTAFNRPLAAFKIELA